ncbi:restriction endonuclease [Pseudoxanthomonas sp. LH2527]|uniref:restriction endonuclease n=1 Tax=Pseudoxanthomonas sp. LH2527 TaxID=2923249 RepID=UPI001F131907|nr:restriction endonuclease [Pseudoxanthomonas sp. LH2527]MCH6483607.1 restriction endonuclease [Pseudoxanthomonas sp. LH2527]
MGRGGRGFIDNLAALPWPVGLCVGSVGYLAVAHGIPLLFARNSAMPGAFRDLNPFLPLAWVFLGLCMIAAGMSFFRARNTRRLLDTRTGLDSMAALGWRDFERLVGEAFRRRGYAVEETGLGGADGGIDLVLRREGRRILVQCKQWRRERVPVNVVREMYGLLAHHRADEVRIAALVGFTPDAARFAAGKPIALIDGPALLAMIRQEQRTGGAAKGVQARGEPAISAKGPKDSSAPTCPRCDTAMVRRSNRRTGETFWGCPAFPMCRGTRIF